VFTLLNKKLPKPQKSTRKWTNYNSKIFIWQKKNWLNINF